MKTSAVFGEFFKAKRQALGLTLREFCLKHELDPGNLSRLERGLLPPPQDRQVLERYARCLGLKAGTESWHTFFDLAAASRGRVPDDLLKDERITARLPLIFKVLRNRRLEDKQLDELVRRISTA